MIKHPLNDVIAMIQEQTESVGIARNSYLAKKAMKRNTEATLLKEAEGDSQKAKEMNAHADPAWLRYEQELNRLEAIYEFQRDKLEVLNKEYMAQYLELKDNSQAIRKQA